MKSMQHPKVLPTFLIVSDSGLDLRFLRENLSDAYEIMVSSEAKEALEILKNMAISMVIIDEKTPTLAPTTLIEAIRHISEVPILVITRHLKKKHTRQLLQAGATNLLNEPLDLEQIHQHIASAFHHQKTHKKMTSVSRAFKRLPTATSPSLEKRFTYDEKSLDVIRDAQNNNEALSILFIAPDQESDKLHSLLQKQLRVQDILMAKGKGQFMIILPKTSKRAAYFIGEALQENIQATTLSIGLVDVSETTHIFELAEERLEKAKMEGNKIVET